MSTNNRSFKDVGVNDQLSQILANQKITSPTPIQEQAIPEVLKGDDVLGVAKTGTGKTLAFVTPLLQMMSEQGTSQTASALIVLPTRELAYQVQESIQWFEKSLKIYSTVIVGGVSQHKQEQALRRKPQIIVATPGRLNDLLQQKKIHLRNTKFVVLDEADRMFDMGFEPQIKEMLRYAPSPQERQTLLFSATMPDAIVDLIQNYMRDPVHIEVATHGDTADKVRQEILVLSNEHRKDALIELIDKTKEAVIVFTRTKHQAKKLNRWLRNKGYKSEELHGNRSLPQRKKAVAALQAKRSRILVATDIAARGIDISHVELVINYDLPEQSEDYVHRIGRTGRAGREGRAISFVQTDQAAELHEIQKLINQQLQHADIETVPVAELDKNAPKKKRGGRGRGRGRGGNRGGQGRNRSNNRNRGAQRKGGNRSNSRSGGGGQKRNGGNRGNSRRSSQ